MERENINHKSMETNKQKNPTLHKSSKWLECKYLIPIKYGLVLNLTVNI